jgi:hypothetical protein
MIRRWTLSRSATLLRRAERADYEDESKMSTGTRVVPYEAPDLCQDARS